MVSEEYFTGSCVPLHRLNCTTTLPWMIDPCSCYKYYQCDTNKDAKLRDCPAGTAFDHHAEICVSKDGVILSGKCQVNEPWKRCELSEEATTQLMQRCTNASTIPPPNAILPPNNDTPNDTGLILGVLFGVLFVLISVVLLAVLLQRRKEMKKKEKLTKKLSVQNPEYNWKDEEEETYNVIDDKMHDPVYNNNSDSTSKPPTLPYRPEEDDGKTKNPDTFDYKVIQMHNKETLQSETIEISSDSLDKSKVITSDQKEDNEPEHDYTTLSEEEHSHEQTDTLSSTLSNAPEPSPYDNSWGVKTSGVQVSD